VNENNVTMQYATKEKLAIDKAKKCSLCGGKYKNRKDDLGDYVVLLDCDMIEDVCEKCKLKLKNAFYSTIDKIKKQRNKKED